MKDFRRLIVWQRAHEAALAVYGLTAAFPSQERYGLVQQLRRAAVSISSNIAEGCGYSSEAEFARFLQVAFGSASEVQCQLILARDLGMGPSTSLQLAYTKTEEVKRMLARLLARIRSSARGQMKS